jgi:3,4-dihydroxy 2-butanone 4-phosphate synthase/GTP cyclohydrolase II
MAIDPRYSADDFVRPGHVNPLRARDGGVLVRAGQTEGSIDLCRLAGLTPAAVIIEIMKPDGEMARAADLDAFCARHHLKMCSVAQIISHRLSRESLIRRTHVSTLATPHGDFSALLYDSLVDPLPHLVLWKGPLPERGVTDDRPTLVRMHRRHLLGDVFGDLTSATGQPSGDTLRAAMRMIHAEGRGAIVYLRTQGPAGDGHLESLLQSPRLAPADPDRPALDAPEGAVLRDYGVGGQILRDLGLSRIRLITTSNRNLPGLDAFGLEITDRVPPST